MQTSEMLQQHMDEASRWTSDKNVSNMPEHQLIKILVQAKKKTWKNILYFQANQHPKLIKLLHKLGKSSFLATVRTNCLQGS